jgi:hypothetical protein
MNAYFPSCRTMNRYQLDDQSCSTSSGGDLQNEDIMKIIQAIRRREGGHQPSARLICSEADVHADDQEDANSCIYSRPKRSFRAKADQETVKGMGSEIARTTSYLLSIKSSKNKGQKNSGDRSHAKEPSVDTLDRLMPMRRSSCVRGDFEDDDDDSRTTHPMSKSLLSYHSVDDGSLARKSVHTCSTANTSQSSLEPHQQRDYGFLCFTSLCMDPHNEVPTRTWEEEETYHLPSSSPPRNTWWEKRIHQAPTYPNTRMMHDPYSHDNTIRSVETLDDSISSTLILEDLRSTSQASTVPTMIEPLQPKRQPKKQNVLTIKIPGNPILQSILQSLEQAERALLGAEDDTTMCTVNTLEDTVFSAGTDTVFSAVTDTLVSTGGDPLFSAGTF